MPQARHFAAIGRFVVECSMIEVVLHLLVRRIVGIEDKIARVIIGGPGDMRVPDLIRLCKQVAPIMGLPKEVVTLQDRMLNWVAYANDVRSVIAHKPFWRDTHDVLVFHNAHHAKSEERAWSYRCSLKQLNNLTALVKGTNLVFITLPSPSQWKAADRLISDLPQRSPDAALLQKLGLPDRPADIRQPNAK